MRRSLYVVAVVILTLGVAPPVLALSCSCTAPDGSCSASVTCSGGCGAICMSSSGCSAWCSGGGGGESPDQKNLTGGRGKGGPEHSKRISMELKEVSAAEFSQALSAYAGTVISFAPRIDGELLSVQIQNSTVGDVIAQLAKLGAVATSAAAATSSGVELSDRVSLEAKGITVGTLAEMVEQLTGGRGSFMARSPHDQVNLEIKDSSVEDLLRQLAHFGAVTLDGVELKPR